MKNFWKNKKVFITGHTGFKGAWLTLMLHELGANVTGYSDDVPTKPSVFQLARCSELLKSDHRGDICDLESLNKALIGSEAEVVFHLAAQPIVRKSYTDPVTTYQTNVMGTLNILMACSGSQTVKSIVNITSDKCYENNDHQKLFQEDDHLGGFDPYSSSKACAEIVSASMRSSFLAKKNIHMATARAGNVIGGGDWAPDRLIPDFLRCFLTGQKVKIRNPASVRPWQHVMEPLHGYLILAEKNYLGPDFAEAFNFGPGRSETYSVSDVIRMFHEFFPDLPGIEIEEMKERPHEANFLKLNCSKAKEKLGWSSKLNFKEIIQLTAEWYQAQFAERNMRDFSQQQIRDYLERSEASAPVSSESP